MDEFLRAMELLTSDFFKSYDTSGRQGFFNKLFNGSEENLILICSYILDWKKRLAEFEIGLSVEGFDSLFNISFYNSSFLAPVIQNSLLSLPEMVSAGLFNDNGVQKTTVSVSELLGILKNYSEEKKKLQAPAISCKTREEEARAAMESEVGPLPEAIPQRNLQYEKDMVRSMFPFLLVESFPQTLTLTRLQRKIFLLCVVHKDVLKQELFKGRPYQPEFSGFSIDTLCDHSNCLEEYISKLKVYYESLEKAYEQEGLLGTIFREQRSFLARQLGVEGETRTMRDIERESSSVQLEIKKSVVKSCFCQILQGTEIKLGSQNGKLCVKHKEVLKDALFDLEKNYESEESRVDYILLLRASIGEKTEERDLFSRAKKLSGFFREHRGFGLFSDETQTVLDIRAKIDSLEQTFMNPLYIGRIIAIDPQGTLAQQRARFEAAIGGNASTAQEKQLIREAETPVFHEAKPLFAHGR